MRVTAIRQANVYALAELPNEVTVLLAELKLAEAQALLEKLATGQRGKQAANRLLASMWRGSPKQGSCLPYTEFFQEPVPITSLLGHDQAMRELLRTVPPEVANRLVDSQPLFERQTVLAACGQLTLDDTVMKQVIESATNGDDEDRLFIQQVDYYMWKQLPPRPTDPDGNPKPPYSRSEILRLQKQLNAAWSGLEPDQWAPISAAIVEAENHPAVWAQAGKVLSMWLEKLQPVLDPARGARYLDRAAERGDLLALQWRGMQLLTNAETAEQGYVISLFARHLNAIGCYPGDYLKEWTRTYRYVEEYAQAMSPVTLQVTGERAKRYIAEHGPKAYARLYCTPVGTARD